MGNATPTTPEAGVAGQQPSQPVTPGAHVPFVRPGSPAQRAQQRAQQPAQQTQQAPAGEQGGQGGGSAAPASDWEKLDWGSVDWEKVPVDKLNIPNIEKIPGVSKMQSALRKQASEFQTAAQKAQAENAALKKQLEEMSNLIRGKLPQQEQHMNQIQAQAEAERMRQELEFYQRQNVVSRFAEEYGVPQDLYQEIQSPQELFEKAIDFHRTRATTTEQEWQRRFSEMEKQLQALQRQGSDPAANADRGQATGSTNWQARYNEAVKNGNGPEADAIERQAFSSGVAIDVVTPWRERHRNR